MHESNWLAKLYTEERRRLFLIAWNVLRDRQAAEDAVHAAFVRLVRLTKPPSDARLYAFQAVRNAAIDIRRQAGRSVESMASGELDSAEVSDPRAAELGLESETGDQLEKLLELLPEASREVVELHLHEGLGFREIGELVSVPTQTIASRYRRALELLRSKLGVIRHE